jgi:predicted outer membrane protein
MQDVTMVIEAFQTAADSGANPQVRSFAQRYLPMMQQHLQMALTI